MPGAPIGGELSWPSLQLAVPVAIQNGDLVLYARRR